MDVLVVFFSSSFFLRTVFNLTALTFDERREECDICSLATSGRKSQPDAVQFVAEKFPAVFRLRPAKEEGERNK